MTQAIIGLCGVAGSGKSTVADILVRKHGFVRKPFAYQLKSMIAALGFSRSELDGPASGKEIPLDILGGRTLREAMQTLGTEWGRVQFGEDFWVRMWMQGVDGPCAIVADDVRFPNEARAVQKLGGFVVRLVRDGAGSSVGSDHISEQLDHIPTDFEFHNSRSLKRLDRDVAALLGRMNLRAA